MRLKKILVVEDSQLLQKLYGLVLQRYRATGTEVLQAFNGREGLDKLGSNPDLDLIILDINMPVISGLEFLRLVKGDPRYASIPVIIASTEGKEEDTNRGLQAGAVGYFVKPFQPDHLHDLIERLMKADGRTVAAQVVPSVISQRSAGAAGRSPDEHGPARRGVVVDDKGPGNRR